jgi:hypothetical protein
MLPGAKVAKGEEATERTDVTPANLRQAEPQSKVSFVGTLLEIGSTEVPTTLIVRTIKEGDITVNVNEKTILIKKRGEITKLEDWIPGDQLRVIGWRNENTRVVEASVIINHSMERKFHYGLNGWITAINKEASTFDIQWRNKIFTFRYNEKTHFVVPPKIQASIDDLKIGDRVRGRYIHPEGEMPQATIVVVLRRGSDLLMKVRTWVFEGELTEINSYNLPTDIKVEIKRVNGRPEDINTLLKEKEERIVHITEKTRLTSRFLGRTNLSDFFVGNGVMIVGRLNDDGTIEAKVLRNDSFWKLTPIERAGEIIAINPLTKVFQVKGKNGIFEVAVMERVKIIKAGKEINFEDLAVGDEIQVKGVTKDPRATIRAYLIRVVKSASESSQ